MFLGMGSSQLIRWVVSEVNLVLLMEEIRRSPVDMVNIPVIYKAIFIPGGAGFRNHQQYEFNSNLHTI